MKVLIIEDDHEIVESVRLCFQIRWPEAELLTASEGQKGLDLAKGESPDLVVLDLGLPDIGGLDVLKEIRGSSNVPLIILTARGDELSKIRGLELGADDYIVKPFSAMEFLSRIRAVLRRSQMPVPEANVLPSVRRKLMIDYNAKEVFIGDKRVNLAPSAYKLLCELVSSQEKFLSEQLLIKRLYGMDESAQPDRHIHEYVRVHVNHLRRALEADPESPEMILGEPGVGYRFVGSV